MMSVSPLFSALISLFYGTQFCLTETLIPWPPKQDFIAQPVDHFNFPPNAQLFNLRYLYEEKWYKPGGPVLFYCGNEARVESYWNNTGYMFEQAVELNGLIVFAEHRYYGESLPFSKSFIQPYIQYLSVEQALADFAYLVVELRERFKLKNAPVIAYGGSYGGMLAAYMRVKYPHLIAGAIASSAPMHWVAGFGRFHEFFEIVTRDFKTAKTGCSDRIKRAYTQLEALASRDLKSLSKTLNLCDEMKGRSEFDWMLKWSRNAFVMMTMLDYPTEVSFMERLPANPVNVSCDRAMAAPDDISALLQAIGVLYNNSGTGQCFDYKRQYIECADITGCGLGDSSLAWDFQCCTEMNLFDESRATDDDMFPSLPFTRVQLIEYCKKTWNVTPAFHQLATYYGPDVWKSATNILFVNGDLDPWMGGGILEDQSPTVRSLVVHGGAHHLDLRASDPNDPPSVRDVRRKETEMILEILRNHDNRLLPLAFCQLSILCAGFLIYLQFLLH
ncbi:unnamed protein product [Calicophoron daubneyi]|uniref:Dipeptidyl peptidase 2 n=1 Tax=Calicophoron daubneyi TaxID=300641 RepID=A0AAV2TEG8_CALDB